MKDETFLEQISAFSPENGDGAYDFVSPRLGRLDSDTALILALAKTPPFRRLTTIRFLGALDYCLIPAPNGKWGNRRFTRYQHSLGVAALAKVYATESRQNEVARLTCVAAAMLHDIGHPPFSHSIENQFSRAFGIDHHMATKKYIMGQIAGSERIPEILRNSGINPHRVLDVLDGNDIEFDQFFSGPINFDTIEGILRSRRFFKFSNSEISPVHVVRSLMNRHQEKSQDIVDTFWQCKDDMYNLIIRSKSGVVFDSLFQAIAAHLIDEGKLVSSDFFDSERTIMKKFPIFRDATRPQNWKNLFERFLPSKIGYIKRRFYIDDHWSFRHGEDAKRYRQEKISSELYPDAVA